MTVSARSVNFSASSDTPVLAGTYPFEADDLVADWHTHELHQIEYALAGVVEVETSSAHYLLPSQQAVWIPAGLAHRTTLRRVRTVSVFFAPELVPNAPPEARVLAAAPVIREMIVYGARWPIMRTTSDPVADTFFRALANLVTDWLEHETPLCLPTSDDPLVAAAMHYTNAHLGEVRAQDVGRAVGVSERTLRRQFRAATGMEWRRYLLEGRLLRAMALLVEPNRTVMDVATDVGFDSVSAFTRAFGRYTGETPTAYRRRVNAPS
jgi:AraC-like DNA-binding protein